MGLNLLLAGTERGEDLKEEAERGEERRGEETIDREMEDKDITTAVGLFSDKITKAKQL